MSCSTLIGVTAAGGVYTARWLHWGGDPAQMLPLLRRIWQHPFTRHALATVQALTRHDWLTVDYPAHQPAPRSGGRPVPGVGFTAGLQDGIRRGRVDEPVAGYLEWMYLIDVATTPVPGHAEGRGLWLRPVGTEFNLILPGSYGGRQHRLRRDLDGWLLLDVPVPDWSWRLLPAEGARR